MNDPMERIAKRRERNTQTTPMTLSQRKALHYAKRLREHLGAYEDVSPQAAIEQAAALLGINDTTADAMIQASDDLQISHQALWNLLTYTYSILQA